MGNAYTTILAALFRYVGVMEYQPNQLWGNMHVASLVSSSLVLSCLVLSCLVESSRVLSGLVWSCLANNDITTTMPAHLPLASPSWYPTLRRAPPWRTTVGRSASLNRFSALLGLHCPPEYQTSQMSAPRCSGFRWLPCWSRTVMTKNKGGG